MYFFNRLLQAVAVLLLATVPIFLIINLAPGDPATLMAGTDASPATVAAIRDAMGLDRPWYIQYWSWISRIAQGDLGTSYFYLGGTSVSGLMASKIGPTAELAIFSMFLSVCIAIPVGVLSALTYRGALDRVLMTFGTAAIAVPNFWLAIVLIMIFSQWLNWLPAGGRVSSFFEDPITGIKQLFLPGLTLALYTAAIQMRFIRASMLEVLSHDYIRTARAKGLSEATIVIKHALRNSLLPFLTVAGVQFGYLLAGALIVENVFAWPGLGQLVLSGIRNRDYQLVQGCLLLFVFIVVSINLLIDILYHLVDPRTASRVGRKNAS